MTTFEIVLVWYSVFTFASIIAIFSILWFGRLLEITKSQLKLAMGISIILAFSASVYAFISTTSQPIPYPPIYVGFKTYFYAVASFVFICLPYFLIAGRRNMIEKYNIDIRNKWPWQIKKLKNSLR